MSLLLESENVFLRPDDRAGREILKNINLKFFSGSLNVIMGPLGSGKSSLFRLLSGNCKPSSGKIFFREKDIYSFSSSERISFRRRSAFISGDDKFISACSVSENLEAVASMAGIPHKVAFERVLQVLKVCELLKNRDMLPGKLSAGEKKLFKLALALVREPELILADLNLSTGHFSCVAGEILKNAASRGSAVVVSASDGLRLNVPPENCLHMENGEIK